jgi:7-cyano-7-deazaguanine synthase
MTAMINGAVCLVSGGMDSCITAAVAAAEQRQLAFLHVSYGQLTESRELRAFQDISDHYTGNRRLSVDVGHLREIGGSALTDQSISLPEGVTERAEIPVSYVPFRNANLLSVGVSWAEVIGANYLYIGAVEEDSPGYPDCRREFFDAFEETIRLGTRPETRISVKTPLINLSKREIVLKGIELQAPLHLTWSCYSSSTVPCGHCDSCVLRARGFADAGVPDPLLSKDPA